MNVGVQIASRGNIIETATSGVCSEHNKQLLQEENNIEIINLL
jgi:hypothetical protein